MNPYIILLNILITVGVGVGGFKLGVDHEQSSQLKEEKHISQAIEAATQSAAQAIANIKVVNKTIHNKIEHEVRTETVYNNPDCRHTANGVLLINQALSPTQSVSNSKLP